MNNIPHQAIYSDLLRHLPLKYSKVTAMRGITFEILWKKNKVMIKKIGKENHSWNNYHIIGNESAIEELVLII